MKPEISIWKRVALVAILLCGMLLVGVQQAYAQGAIVNGSVAAGETVDRDLLLYGNEIRIDGTVNGDVVAVGNIVTLNGEVNGSLVIIASQAMIFGKLRDSAYTAAGVMTLGPEAALERALYYIGGLLTTQQGASIGRDLNALSVGATLNGSVSGETRAVIGIIPMAQWFIQVTGLRMPDSFQLPFLNRGQSTISPGTPLTAGVPGLLPLMRAAQTGIDPVALQDWLVKALQMLAPLLIVGLLATWLMPHVLYTASERVRTRTLASFGYGLEVFFAGLGVAILTLLLTIMLGYFFFQAYLPVIGWTIWWLGIGALSLGLAMFYVVVAFVSKLVVSYLIGRLILERFWPRAAQRFTCTLLGLVIFVLLAMLPTIGWIFSVVGSFIGLGATWMAVRHKTPEAEAETPVLAETVAA